MLTLILSFLPSLQFLYIQDVLQWRAQATPDHPLFLVLNAKVPHVVNDAADHKFTSFMQTKASSFITHRPSREETECSDHP